MSQWQRRARLIEVDPRYADVICERWELYSGKPAIRNADGVTFAELAEERREHAARSRLPAALCSRSEYTKNSSEQEKK